MAELKQSTWRQLVELTVHISGPQLQKIFTEILNITALDQLTEEQGQAVIKAIETLPKLEGIVRQSLQRSLDQDVHSVVDDLAMVLLKQLDLSKT